MRDEIQTKYLNIRCIQQAKYLAWRMKKYKCNRIPVDVTIPSNRYNLFKKSVIWRTDALVVKRTIGMLSAKWLLRVSVTHKPQIF